MQLKTNVKKTKGKIKTEFRTMVYLGSGCVIEEAHGGEGGRDKLGDWD